jgi:hypothetical protein
MYIVYNCGYYSALTKNGPVTGRKYAFRKRFVTEVDDKDGEAFLRWTCKDIAWCEAHPRTMPPFMSLQDWCEAKPGRFGNDTMKFIPEDYLAKMLLK